MNLSKPVAKVLSAFIVGTFLLLTGCESTKSTKVVEPAVDIQKGTSTADVIATLGEPLRIEHIDNERFSIEVWYYEDEKLSTTLAPIRMIEVPYVNPLTGIETKMLEPDLVPQTSSNKTLIQIFIQDEKVLGWKVDKQNKSQIDG